MVAWKDVFLPKDEGGLELEDMKSWNYAKSLRNIHQKRILGLINFTLKGLVFGKFYQRKMTLCYFKKLLEIRDPVLKSVAVFQINAWGLHD